ncbi:radical SAM protein [Candidatus Pacearchaeota archaeon]|nr:radical SAM protein [Candidatus Pacearchaeota archaeon]
MALAFYSTPAKLANLVKCEIEKRNKVIQPRSLPYIATFEVANVCNLQCLYCPTGQGKLDRKPSNIKLSILNEVIDQVGKYIFVVNLFNFGEPLLNKQIPKMIELCHKHKMLTTISTNLNIIDKRLLNKICEAGLDYLILSIDGACQETYVKYRRKGNLNLVLENIKHIVAYKKKNKKQIPLIEWQYLIFTHNINEVNAAKKIAKKIGVDIFRARPGLAPPEEAVSSFKIMRSNILKKFCKQLWYLLVVQTDGGISACCYLFDKMDDFGNINTESIKDIWNNKKFVEARRLFNLSLSKGISIDYEGPCLRCPIVHRQNHLKDYIRKKGRREMLLGWQLTEERIFRRKSVSS